MNPASRDFARRDFLKFLGTGAAVSAFQPWPFAMAGPFTRDDFEKLVPSDKKLSPQWVNSLMARGERTKYRGAALANIGMPIGGLFAGQLYLGGDGKLWHWDIFNQKIGTGPEHYAKPMKQASPLEQGFALRLNSGGTTQIRPLDAAHWQEVSFIGEYPIGYVEYSDPASPLSVSLEAFSPFVPHDVENSSLPATVLEFTISNTSQSKVTGELAGWLENAVCIHSGQKRSGTRRNRIVRNPGLLFLECSADPSPTPADEADFGTMGLALMRPNSEDVARASVSSKEFPTEIFSANPGDHGPSEKPFDQKLLGSLGRNFKLAPGKSVRISFALVWHFPNLKLNRLPPGRAYGNKFHSALDVATYVSKNLEHLASQTRLWHDTWYDSTLPFWFLDRTFLNTSILATSTCYRLGTGRFYAFEGVGCCEGTCGHVWQYAHAMARLFPQLERQTREQVDFGVALQPDGAIHFRAELNDIPAIDAQAGTILRALREHQMTTGNEWLKRNWPKIRLATEWLIRKDGDENGLIGGNQHNTLDTDWFGSVAWLSGLYLAALLAAAEMADVVGDSDFAGRCRRIAETGRGNFVHELFDDGYFVNKVDSRHLDAINSGSGCHIDQVMGQSWAFQVGLPRVLPEKETRSALRSLWRYNFTPDVGPYRDNYKPGRWYAMPGEAGLLMCTFPRTDWDYAQAKGKGPDWAAGYFNECMNGFEYQVAGHMLWEGLVTEGLAITRAVHDRYHASRRNPWNEVECGDHYARSMASYGVFLAACGFEYDGPRRHIGFAPRLTPENFKAPFTTAEGWGTYCQQRTGSSQVHSIMVKKGSLRLRTFSVELPPNANALTFTAKLGRNTIPARTDQEGSRILVTFGSELSVGEKTPLRLIIGLQN
jgi:uncharacterized protein (DUF608 family)